MMQRTTSKNNTSLLSHRNNNTPRSHYEARWTNRHTLVGFGRSSMPRFIGLWGQSMRTVSHYKNNNRLSTPTSSRSYSLLFASSTKTLTSSRTFFSSLGSIAKRGQTLFKTCTFLYYLIFFFFFSLIHLSASSITVDSNNSSKVTSETHNLYYDRENP